MRERGGGGERSKLGVGLRRLEQLLRVLHEQMCGGVALSDCGTNGSLLSSLSFSQPSLHIYMLPLPRTACVPFSGINLSVLSG